MWLWFRLERIAMGLYCELSCLSPLSQLRANKFATVLMSILRFLFSDVTGSSFFKSVSFLKSNLGTAKACKIFRSFGLLAAQVTLENVKWSGDLTDGTLIARTAIDNRSLTNTCRISDVDLANKGML